ncbi:MAG: histidine--tRNA ligase [Thermodesulfobacteriota bacterium]|jgi:histidyl-tRNA synthetase|nr:histidine--tRNA ligase [Candidatus Dadabacteria bacterium]|tara:strand:+ start:1180 stop:2469 length:1290 start_codon:yes stop_codon:yes gene_type:complete
MKLIKGFRDIFPDAENDINNSALWNYIIESIKQSLYKFNFSEIITPPMEYDSTFKSGIGDDSDIVSKEMYEFLLKKEDEIVRNETFCLRPEGTASVVRSYLEHSLGKKKKVNKLFYCGSMFRYERSQRGRYRQFHQIGAEILGSKNIYYEVELIGLALDILKNLQITDFILEINNIGDKISLQQLSQKVFEFANDNKDKINPEDFKIVEKNPLRFLDKAIHKYEFSDIPSSKEFLNNESNERFNELKELLNKNSIKFKVNEQLVRGIDYYNDTVFEIKSSELGSQDTILAGGRYDNLVEKFGGPPTDCIGFAAGIERLILIVNNNVKKASNIKIDFYVIYQSDGVKSYAYNVLDKIRNIGFRSEMDLDGKSFIKQLKSASKNNSLFTAVIGEEEKVNNFVKIKELSSGDEFTIKFDNQFQEKIIDLVKK